MKIKDPAKDIIISGGKNISSLEMEEVLYQQHPDVMGPPSWRGGAGRRTCLSL